MSDKTGLPPMTQEQRLALAGLDDEDVVYRLALMSFSTHNQFVSLIPDRVIYYTVLVLTHGLCETGFTREPTEVLVKREITKGMKPLPIEAKLQVAGLDDENVIRAAVTTLMVHTTHPETPQVTIGGAAVMLTHTLLELGFHR